MKMIVFRPSQGISREAASSRRSKPVGMDDFSRHQQGIIKRFYDNRETIALQKLGELVTELYLAQGKERAKLWKQAEQALKGLKLPEDRISHIISQDSPELLAQVISQR